MVEAAPPTFPTESESPQKQKLIAPLWHTIVFVLIIVGISALSYFTTRQFTGAHGGGLTEGERMLTYAGTLIQEWVLFLYVYLGMRRRVTVRQCINARWAGAGDVWRDIGIAFGVWAVLIVIEGVFSVIVRSHGAAGTKVVEELIPHAAMELPVWTALAISAGFCEEFIFRGYLQEQCKRLTGSVAVAVVIQAIFFGLGHGYQGWTHMIAIFLLGLVFGIVAAWRKSLAPTMIAHGWTDWFSGIGGYVLHAMHKI
ncbi:MAG TPA: CPBP family intramembrane glutamic endopeptidase [Candidatus Acidoferrales bacterium]|nr:CPBP family intramembrane glutamic endopeptidase [Candidatus Acidoferrales bacterium]